MTESASRHWEKGDIWIDQWGAVKEFNGRDWKDYKDEDA